MELQHEILIANRYKLIRQLGHGGFSEVWLAEDTTVGLQLAVKIFAPNGGLDQEAQKVFSEEYKSVFSLNHQNLLIPQHLDFYQDMPFLILPYCEKGSLVKKVGSITEKEAWKIIYDVAAGLDYLHKHEIVHQDIKPDNILVTADERYMITDFGISVRLQSTLRKSVNKAAEAGTVSYMAPERFSAHPKPIFASDVWSLGAMMYELIEGDVPYGNMGGVLQKSGAEIPEIEANVSDELKNIIRQMMALEPWDRPTADKLVEIARNAIEGKINKIAPSTPTKIKKEQTTPQQAQSKQQRNSKIKWAAISFAVILFCVAIAVLVKEHKGGDEAPYPVDTTEINISSNEELEEDFEVQSNEQQDYNSKIASKNRGEEKKTEVPQYSQYSKVEKESQLSKPSKTIFLSSRNYLGPFSVSATQKVKFAPGNLQFNAAQGTHRCADGTTKQGTWRFAEHQWDYVGDASNGNVYYNGTKCNNANISETYDGWIDLFGWGTSGWNSGAVAYQPWSTSTSSSDYYPGGNYLNDLTGAYANADWGVYNQIGSDVPGTWRTLTDDEWNYLFFERAKAEKLFGLGSVNGVNGTIILPDDWVTPSGLSFTPSIESGFTWSGLYYTGSNGFSHNTYTESQWVQMEACGAVFLPAAGDRYGMSVNDVGSDGYFWSASQDSTFLAYNLNSYSSGLTPQQNNNRFFGFSLRLVSVL